jgi:glycosyltransferase involved in cell wall biosynthesis
MATALPRLPLVSICIPLFNAAEYIEETLERILKQSYKNIEIVVIDDHSTDESYSLAKAFEADSLRVYKNCKKGGNAARNYAFEKSKGSYIKFMDADDYCSETMIENQLNRLLEDGTNDTLIFSPLRMLHPNGEIQDPERTIDHDYEPGIELVISIWNKTGFNCPHSHLMHRQLVDRCEGWNEKLIKNQDGEYFARVASKADKALVVMGDYAMWRQTEKGVSVKSSLEAHASVLESYRIVINLIRAYKDTEDNKDICAKIVGSYVSNFYLQLKPLMPIVLQILKDLERPVILPDRKIHNILSKFLGWKLAIIVKIRFNFLFK